MFFLSVRVSSNGAASVSLPTQPILNLFFILFGLAISSNIDYEMSSGGYAKSFVATSVPVIFLYVFIRRGTAQLPASHGYQLSLFFLFALAAAATGDLVELSVITEFINIGIVLVLVQAVAVFTGGVTNSVSIGRIGSPKYALGAVLTFFFLMFFIAILFFIFFFLFIFIFNSETTYFNLSDLRLYRTASGTQLFLFMLALKLGGAPLHLWKLEIFAATRYDYFFYFSTIYLYLFMFLLRLVRVRLGLIDEADVASVLGLIVISTLAFVIANVGAVVDVRHFIVVSTLLNSSLLLIAVFLATGSRQDLFFLLFGNYLLASTLLFYYFIYYASNVKFVLSLRAVGNQNVNFIFFLSPILALAGVAPSLGFFIKFMLVFNS